MLGAGGAGGASMPGAGAPQPPGIVGCIPCGGNHAPCAACGGIHGPVACACCCGGTGAGGDCARGVCCPDFAANFPGTVLPLVRWLRLRLRRPLFERLLERLRLPDLAEREVEELECRLLDRSDVCATFLSATTFASVDLA